jgi:hypothetical protein
LRAIESGKSRVSVYYRGASENGEETGEIVSPGDAITRTPWRIKITTNAFDL